MSHVPKLDKLVLSDTDVLDLDHFLGENFDEIANACEELPPVMEWINQKYQSIYERKLIKKQEIEEIKAKVYFDLKSGLFEQRGYAGKATETAIERAVVLEKEVKKVYREYAVLDGWSRRLVNLQIVLQAKLDLIRSSEATRRKIITETEDDT